jgi:hypothetical protein
MNFHAARIAQVSRDAQRIKMTRKHQARAVALIDAIKRSPSLEREIPQDIIDLIITVRQMDKVEFAKSGVTPDKLLKHWERYCGVDTNAE